LALSPAAQKLVAALRLTRPVRIDAFVSDDLPPELAPVEKRLAAALRDLQSIGQGKIQTRVHHVDEAAEEAARGEDCFGITALPVTSTTKHGTRTDNLFMGVAFTCGLESVTVPFLQPDVVVEYEL